MPPQFFLNYSLKNMVMTPLFYLLLCPTEYGLALNSFWLCKEMRNKACEKMSINT